MNRLLFPCLLTGLVALLAAAVLAAASPASAQTKVSPYEERQVRPGISLPGPRRVAPTETENVFIFYPKHNMYYDVDNDRYIYRKSDRWLIYNQVPMDDTLGPSHTIVDPEGKPYLKNEEHLKQYPYEPK